MHVSHSFSFFYFLYLYCVVVIINVYTSSNTVCPSGYYFLPSTSQDFYNTCTHFLYFTSLRTQVLSSYISHPLPLFSSLAAMSCCALSSNTHRALRLTRQSHEKDHAFAGLIALINANPSVLYSPSSVTVPNAFFVACSSWEDPPDEPLLSQLSRILRTYKVQTAPCCKSIFPFLHFTSRDFTSVTERSITKNYSSHNHNCH